MDKCVFLECLEGFLNDFFDCKKVDYNIFCIKCHLKVVIFFNTNVYIIDVPNYFNYVARDLAVVIYKKFLKDTLKDIYGDCKFVDTLSE